VIKMAYWRKQEIPHKTFTTVKTKRRNF